MSSVQQNTIDNLNFVNQRNQVNQQETTDTTLSLLIQAMQILGQAVRQHEQQGTVTPYATLDDKAQESASPLSQQELQEALERDQELMYGIKDEDDNTSADNATGSTEEGDSSSSSSTGMQAVFDMQGWITALMGDATENNSVQAQMEAQNGEALEKSMEKQYEEIEKKEKKAKKKEKQHSVWGFIKGLGSLLKDIDKMIGDLTKDLATLNMSNLSKDVSSDANKIKNNAAIGDLVDLGKLCFQVVKLVGDAEGNLLTGNIKGLKSEAKGDFKSIEENPSLSFAIQLLSYAAVAASLVGAAATGGALSFLVVAAITVVAMASTLNSGGDDVLEALGVPKSVAQEIMCIPSFDDVSKGVTDALAPALKALGVSQKDIKIIGDATTVLAVAAAAGITGNIGIVAMAFGTTLSSLSQKIADDSGTTGLTNTILTLSLAATGAVVAGAGACGMAKGAGELSETAEQVMAAANKVNYVTQIAGGSLDILSGAKQIDLGFDMKDIANLQSKMDVLTTQIKLTDTQLNNTSEQLEDIVSQYEQMINTFGTIAAPAEATAWALA